MKLVYRIYSLLLFSYQPCLPYVEKNLGNYDTHWVTCPPKSSSQSFTTILIMGTVGHLTEKPLLFSGLSRVETR